MLSDEFGELAHQLVMAAEGKLERDTLFDAADAQLIQPDRRHPDKLAVNAVEARPSTEPESIAVPRDGEFWAAGITSLASCGNHVLEALGIEFSGLDPD